MADEQVIDASVIGAALFNEAESETARRFLVEGPPVIAPDLLRAEIASLAAKKVWRSEASEEAGHRAMAVLSDFIAEFVSSKDTARRAFDLAARFKISAYDALYLALAENRETKLITLDRRLIARAEECGLKGLARRP